MSFVHSERPPFLTRIIRAFGPKALLTWALLLVVVYTMTSGLVEAVPNLEISMLALVATLGMTLGWMLAQIPLKAGWAALLSFLLGFEFLLVRVGSLGGSIAGVVGAGLRALLSFLLGFEFLLVRVGSLGESIAGIMGAGLRALVGTVQWYWTEQPPAWDAVWALSLELLRDMGTLLSRTFGWLSALAAGSTSFDVVGAAIVWGLIVWAYSVWAGWVVRRTYRPLLGVLPGSLVLSYVISYTGSNPYIFLPVVGVSLVLMALMHQMSREARWSRTGVDFSQGLWSDVTLVASGLSVALVIAAAIAPSITVEKIREWVEDVTERPTASSRTEAVAEGLGLEPKPEPRPVRPIESMMSTGLPQRHLIGSGPELSRMVVMIVETGELPSLPDDLYMEEAPRHYWRSITYDRYFSRGWSTSNTEMVEYPAGELVTQMDAPHLRTLRQSVRLVGPQAGNIVHVDGTLVSVDQDFVVSMRPPGELFAATTEERQYRADSLYSVTTADQLREASLIYPDWILSRYLQLPDTVPTRVTDLALELTATQPTPYDRAIAIESYLRENFTYNLDVDIPGGNDIADFFLFELKEGYCDYYATSMVVLARAAGLPARLVIGYVSGGYDPVAARYVVTEADAHAWPEIYFPEYGWIEFEPTAGRAPIVRGTESEAPIWPEGTGPQPLVESKPSLLPQVVVGVWILIVVGSVLGVVGLATGLDSMRLYLAPPERLVVRLQRRVRSQARRLKVPLRRGDTPNETAALMGARIREIAAAHGFTGVEFVEPAADEIQELADLYVRTWYSPEGTLSRQMRWRAAWLWWRLRWRLAVARLWRRSGMLKRMPEDESEISLAPEELRRQKDQAQDRLRPPPS